MAFSLSTEEISQVNGQISLQQIFQLSIFVLSREKCLYRSHRVTFGFSFRILIFCPFMLNLNVAVCERYEFFCVSAAVIRENSCSLPWIESNKSFADHEST